MVVKLPQKLLDSLDRSKGFDKEAFEKVHASGEQITSIRINPAKTSRVNDERSMKEFIHDPRLPIHEKIPWTQYGYYLSERPSFTFDPLFHAGCYYVQEASSMFLEQALKQTVDLSKPIKVLDLCAAPGGKSTHIHSLISKNSLLVSNEVIRSRVNILKDNIIKWGCDNVVVTNNDPKDFGKLENYFDVIVIDAPCSGSGLFRRDPGAIDEWSEGNVQLCSQRQQRIVADVWPALKKDGILIYSTCSYSKEEDEEIVDWMMKELSIACCQLSIDANWGIVDTGKGYRFWPDKLKGEGFFLSVLRKTEGDERSDAYKTKSKVEKLTVKEMRLIEPWVDTEHWSFVKNKDTVYAWKKELMDDFDFLIEQLHVVYSGVLVGEMMRDKLVPDHALAMSPVVSDTIGRIQLSHDQAIAYLQKKDIKLDTGLKGWDLVTTDNDQPLGWVNILPNRVNNYYPKSLRILKDR